MSFNGALASFFLISGEESKFSNFSKSETVTEIDLNDKDQKVGHAQKENCKTIGILFSSKHTCILVHF